MFRDNFVKVLNWIEQNSDLCAFRINFDLPEISPSEISEILRVTISSAFYKINRFERWLREQSPENRTLAKVLAIVELVRLGFSRKKACKYIAFILNITESTVRDACTRGILLDSIEQFDEMLNEDDLTRLEEHLAEVFPNYKEEIRKKFEEIKMCRL